MSPPADDRNMRLRELEGRVLVLESVVSVLLDGLQRLERAPGTSTLASNDALAHIAEDAEEMWHK